MNFETVYAIRTETNTVEGVDFIKLSHVIGWRADGDDGDDDDSAHTFDSVLFDTNNI